jgi:hypothetical protein
MSANPKADQFGRYRVQTDTGAKISVSRLPFKEEKVLDEPASDVGGDALPIEYPHEKKQPAASITVPPLGAADTKEN